MAARSRRLSSLLTPSVSHTHWYHARSMLDRITPLILTRDEEANIGRTLPQLAWAREVVVVDSMSSDATVEIARRFANVRVVQRAFDSHDRQWSFGVEQVTTPWVLTLDADYFL